MDRNRFIQCMKSNVELSDKERRRIIRKSVESQPWKLKCTIAMEEFAELTQAISKQNWTFGRDGRCLYLSS